MKRFVFMAFGVALLSVLTGCEHPYARLSTLQDPKYPVLRSSKIALPDSTNSPALDLASRLAGESLKEQLPALGFSVAPTAEADFQLGFNVTQKDESVTYDTTRPTMSTIMGTSIDGRPVTGTVMSDQVVSRSRIVDTTQLEVTLRRTQNPPIEVWSGRIATETALSEKYRTAFFRALLERIGETAHGTVQLDSEPANAKP